MFLFGFFRWCESGCTENKEKTLEYLKGEYQEEQLRIFNNFNEKLSVESKGLMSDMYIKTDIDVPTYFFIFNEKSGEYTRHKESFEFLDIEFCVNLIGEYLYIIPTNLEKFIYIEENETHGIRDITDLLDWYKTEMKPNYKDLFFKIKLDDIKFYRYDGETYTDTSGRIDSTRDWGGTILMGDSEFKTNGEIRTKFVDNRLTEFYYNNKGKIETLIFDKDALLKFALLIPDKERK